MSAGPVVAAAAGEASREGGGQGIHDLVLASADVFGDRICQRWTDGRGPRATRDFATLRLLVRRVAKGLMARGIEPGDRVGIVSENRPDWLVADLGVLACGAIDVPRGAESPPGEVGAILAHSGCRLVLLADAAAFARLREALPPGVPVVLFDGEAPPDARCSRFQDLLDLGAENDHLTLPDVGRHDVATLVYTSGTTGRPKGVTLTHENVASNVRALVEVLPVQPGERFLALLPSWHMYERTVEYYALFRGAELSYTDTRRLKADLLSERPQYLASVPRVWERLHDTVMGGISDLRPLSRALARGAVRGSLAHRRAVDALRRRTADTVDRGAPCAGLPALASAALTWPAHLLARRLVHRRLVAATGGRLIAAISGGGAMPAHVDAFFGATGITVLVGYGLTETSPVVAARRPERNVLGTIGTPVAHTELRLIPVEGADAGTGRLAVRGPQVMRGYWEDTEATRAVLDAEGWFDTGDLVRRTSQDDLVFCGRAKDTIVLRGGENVEPEPLEQAACASPLIDQIVVVGQDRKALGALVWPDPDEAARRLGDGVLDPDTVLAGVRSELARLVGPSGGFRPWERIPHVALLPGPLTVDEGTLTATLKVKRSEVQRRHAAAIDALYAPN